MIRVFVGVFVAVLCWSAGTQQALAQDRAGIVLDGEQGAEVELAARDALGKRGILAVDRQTMTAALQFAGANSFDEAGLRAVAKQVGASMMARVQVKPSQAGLALRVVVVTKTDSAVRLTMSKSESLAADVTRLLGEALDELQKNGQAASPATPGKAPGSPAGPGGAPPGTGGTVPAPAVPAPVAPKTKPKARRGHGTSADTVIPGVVPPKTLRPIPLANPRGRFTVIRDPYKRGLLRYPKFFAFGSVNVAAGVITGEDIDTQFDTGMEMQLGVGYTISPRKNFGVGVFSRTAFNEDGSATVIGPAIATGPGVLVGLGLVGSNSFSIADAFVLNLNAVIGMFKISDDLSHGLAINYTSSLVYTGTIQSYAISLGWGLKFGSHNIGVKEINQYRKNVWRHQRRALGL